LKRGFTLVEVLIVTTLCGLVLAVSTGSLLFLAKSTQGLGNYQEMNMTSRFALEAFGSDARMTDDVNSVSSSQVSLEVYNSSGGTDTVVYAYDADEGVFSRTQNGTTKSILEDVQSLSFVFYNLNGSETTNLIEIKEIQLRAEMQRTVLTLDNTNEIISARYMMRNRSVSS